MTARSFLGAGDIYINRMVDGVKQGLVGPIYADSLAITPSVNTVQSTSKGRYDYGQVLESVNIAQPTEFSMALKEVTGDVLVMAFLGTSAAYNEVGGTLNDFQVTAKVGAWVPIGKKNLADLIAVELAVVPREGVFAVDGGSTGDPTISGMLIAGTVPTGTYTGTFTSATEFEFEDAGANLIGTGTLGVEFDAGGFKFTLTAGTTPAILGDIFTIVVTAGAPVSLTEDEDYRLNRPMGWIMALDGGLIADDEVVKITGAYVGATGSNIKGSTRTEVRAEIIFDGINQADGTQCTVTIHEAVLSADSEFDFLADDFGTVNLAGSLKTPVGKDAPYEVLVQNAVPTT